MKGLLLHKLHLLKKSLVFLLLWGIFLTMGTIFIAKEQRTDFFHWVTVFPMTLNLSFIAVSLRHQEKICGWDLFSQTLPVSRKMVVQADYIVQICITLLGCFFAYFQVFLLNMFHFYPDYDQVLFTFVILTVSQSAMYDLNFIFGMDKSNSFFFLPLMLGCIIYFYSPAWILVILFSHFNYFSDSMIVLLTVSHCFVAILLAFCFYKTAVKRMGKLEF